MQDIERNYVIIEFVKLEQPSQSTNKIKKEKKNLKS